MIVLTNASDDYPACFEAIHDDFRNSGKELGDFELAGGMAPIVDIRPSGSKSCVRGEYSDPAFDCDTSVSSLNLGL